MGLADRDYMQEREERDHPGPWGAPEMSMSSTAWLILASLLIAYGGYKTWEWWSVTHPSRPASIEPRSAPAVPNTATRPNVSNNQRSNQPPAPAAPIVPGNVVIKCVLNGTTTYVASEADCAPRAKTTIVRIDPNQNLSDGVPNAAEIIRRPPPYAQVGVTRAGVDPNVKRRALCKDYEEEINSIDARARQPLSGQEQDWLAAKRKKTRDEQYRLRC